MDFKRYTSEKKQYIDGFLRTLLPEAKPVPVIGEAMEYSLFAGGKRLRPILAIMACELFDGRLEEVMPFACCIEMIHTYSLIHDDLPAMDNDDFRRGKPTNHKVYGEGFAVLAGDALLNLAFEIMLDRIQSNPRPEYIKAANAVAKASGISGMIGGQCFDLFYENKKVDVDILKTMHSMKTGALISAALYVGAAVAGAKDLELDNIRRLGSRLGLAFQITDDILDVEGSPERMGKGTRKDLDKHKSNFISFYGLDRSKAIAGELIGEAKAILAAYGDKGSYLSALADYILTRDH